MPWADIPRRRYDRREPDTALWASQGAAYNSMVRGRFSTSP